MLFTNPEWQKWDARGLLQGLRSPPSLPIQWLDGRGPSAGPIQWLNR